MQNPPLSPAAKRLLDNLGTAPTAPAPDGHPVYHVTGIGSSFYFAYEQLRNVAEYRERHLLLRGAIRRFLVRFVRLRRYEPVAADLVTELTQTGYLKNDAISQGTGAKIDELLGRYSDVYEALIAGRQARGEDAAKWIFEAASVQIENLLVHDARTPLIMQFAFEHYYRSIDPKVVKDELANDQYYRIALYCAVQRAIFKSDEATTRYYCLASSLVEPQTASPAHFSELNRLIDELYQAPITNKLYRLITRYGAPMRLLRELIMAGGITPENAHDRAEILARSKALMGKLYAETHEKLNSRIIKTIGFLFATKVIIGVAMEVPYDLISRGEIAWLPLGVNIFFPPLYMATIGARIQTPSKHNTTVVAGYLERILYDGVGPEVTYSVKRRVKSRSLNNAFNFVYALGFIGSFGLLIWILHSLEFNIVNGGIFFVFFSAVSFLGFRLRQSAHELQMVDERQGFVQTALDFLSSPFVRVGHWLSDKYARANIVVLVLDTAIEMPLKTSLRMIQHWVGFLRDKQEEL